MFITLEDGFWKYEFEILYKYFFNDFSKVNHFTFLAFVDHV